MLQVRQKMPGPDLLAPARGRKLVEGGTVQSLRGREEENRENTEFGSALSLQKGGRSRKPNKRPLRAWGRGRREQTEPPEPKPSRSWFFGCWCLWLRGPRSG